MARPRKPDEERARAVSVSLSAAQLDKVDRAALRLGKTRSAVVASLVDRLADH